jgi:hypothetical protein
MLLLSNCGLLYTCQFEAPKGRDTADIASSTLAAVAAQRAAESRQRHEDLTFMTSLDLDNSHNNSYTNGYNNNGSYDPAAVAAAAVTDQACHWWEEEGAGLHPGDLQQSSQQQHGYAALLKRPIDRTARGDPAKLRYICAYLYIQSSSITL